MVRQAASGDGDGIKRISGAGRVRWLLILVVALVSLSFSTVLLELGVRAVNFQPKGREVVPHQFRISDIPGVLYELTPGNRYQWRYGARSLFDDGFSVPVSINSIGFRDDEIRLRKPDGQFRILVVGDSFTMAMGVGVEDGYVERLEGRLNAMTGGRPSVECVNTGVGGYNTRQELAFLRGRGMALQPDMVILGFQVNDVSQQAPYCLDDKGYLRLCGTENKRGLHLDARLFDPGRRRNPAQWLIEESHLVRWLAGRLERGQPRVLQRTAGPRDRNAAAHALLGIRNLMEVTGTPLFVAIFPLIENLAEDDVDMINMRWIAQLCRWREIPHITLDTAVEGIPAEDLWVHPRDHHPNARAHALFADKLAQCFEFVDGGLAIRCSPVDGDRSPPEGFEAPALEAAPERQYQSTPLLSDS